MALPSGRVLVSGSLLEHLAYPGEVLTVLRDWHRVLVPGGRLSVGVPDTVAPLRDYVTGARDCFDWCRTHPWYPPWIETRMDQINFHFRQQGLGFGRELGQGKGRHSLRAKPSRPVRRGPRSGCRSAPWR